ncbi:MAG TPA: amidinotransferase, partial [Chloroflexi bacterium]|nr:amidinotransferase [Chloroflexota bacterium]
MVDPLRRVLVKRPGEAFAVDDPAVWHYAGQPDLEVAQQEHDALVEILREAGAEVLYHEEHQPHRADAIFVHDPAIVTDHGAIILRMGKELRRGEEPALARRLQELGVPILYQ